MSSAAATSPPGQIESYELSKRFYYGGFLGLPWLWIVHVMHWYGKKKDVVRPDQTGTSLMCLCVCVCEYGAWGDGMWLWRWTVCVFLLCPLDCLLVFFLMLLVFAASAGTTTN
jgi:hypothetical protein